MIEDKDYDVTLVLRLTAHVAFAPMERDNPITKADAIDNAIGGLPCGMLETLHGEGYEVAYPIDGEARDYDAIDLARGEASK